jgi:hypothetical protein
MHRQAVRRHQRQARHTLFTQKVEQGWHTPAASHYTGMTVHLGPSRGPITLKIETIPVDLKEFIYLPALVRTCTCRPPKEPRPFFVCSPYNPSACNMFHQVFKATLN